ncbi:unnamed protein product [Phytophthora lilii]|uniref:HECT-type E3 ubiquitin transferase n=1 Tax=Phytophthora lilii TaxID=2077276 RepID=A0A9W6U1L1_9STRA|nr:unnamed protein product [Phytophthora lilii]
MWLCWLPPIWTLTDCVSCRSDRMTVSASWLSRSPKRLAASRSSTTSSVRFSALADCVLLEVSNLLLRCLAVPHNVTEFTYRMDSEGDSEARICMSIQTKTEGEFVDVVKAINKRNDMHAIDLASNELAKSHLRHLAGGRPQHVPNERLFRLEFPERPGALKDFLGTLRYAIAVVQAPCAPFSQMPSRYFPQPIRASVERESVPLPQPRRRHRARACGLPGAAQGQGRVRRVPGASGLPLRGGDGEPGLDTAPPIAVTSEPELTELLFEILRFSAFLLENAANKAVYPSAEPVTALLAARNERVAAEAVKVAAMLALPPQVHRYAADPTSFVDPAAGRNNLLRRRLLTIAQGRGAPKNSLEVVDYLNATNAETTEVQFQFYASEQEGEDATDRVVNVAIPTYEEVVGPSTPPAEAACAAATACERLIKQHKIPKRLHFQLFTRVRACYASRSALARENIVVERLHALLALFSLFSDAWDVTNYVEQHPELTRGVVELVRVDSIERVPVRVRVTALLVLTALVNDRVGRAGGMGVLGRQSNVLQALGVVKGTPHGVFPSLVRYCTAELGDVTVLGSTTTAPGSPSSPPVVSEAADTDMDMSLAVAFVEATTDLLSPQEAEVVGAAPFRNPSSGNVLETKLYWMEAVLGLLTAVVAIQSGAAVLTENGIVPALLHVLTIPAVSPFHMAVTTQCVQALEITVSSHSAASALYRDLNGVGILVDRLKLECNSIVNPKRSTANASAVSETKTVLLLAILASLSMSFHSQGVMSAGATSRAIREGSALNKVLLQLLSNVDVFGPVVFAQTAIVVSDIINNDPSSVNHVHGAGLADAFLKTLTRWDIAELYPSRILLPPSSELLTAVPTVLNALCLTTTHAEKVAKHEPLMHLLDVFALPQYTEDETKDYCFHGDTAAVVGAGIFELMRHVPSFQNAAIQAAVHALKKVIRFGEENISKPSTASSPAFGDKSGGILIRMTTHVADLLEPLLSKSEHAAYFADLGGIRLLLSLYQLILPSTSSFLDSALPSKQSTTKAGSLGNSLAHNPAVQSITLALRSYASQQPTNLLTAIVKELSSQMDSLQRARAKVGLPWYLSESGEGAEGVLSALPDIDLTEMIGANDKSSGNNATADKVMIAGEYLRVLAVLEWLASVLIWTLETAHTHMQSRRWFTDFATFSTQQVIARLFRIDRSVQFERASLAALHQKKRKERRKEAHGIKADDKADVNMDTAAVSAESKEGPADSKTGKSQGAGLWKMGSLLLLRFSMSMRGLLAAYSKVFLSAPMQHRRGDDIVVPLAPHARTLARTVTQILEGHLLYVVAVNRATQIDTFVQQYYLTFLLETISVVLFEGKKKQANTLLLVDLMKPIAKISEVQISEAPPQILPASSDDIVMAHDSASESEGGATKAGKTIATCAGAQITASNLMDVIMNIIERFFTVCLEEEPGDAFPSKSGNNGVKPSQMALTSFHIAASVLRKLSNLEGLSASPLTAALLTSDEAGDSDEAPFEPRKLTVQLHGMCVRALLSIWKHPNFGSSPVDSCLAEVMPIAVTILKNRMDKDDEAAGSDDEGELGGRRQGLGFRGNRERNSSSELYNEALSLRRALFGGSRGGGASGLGSRSSRQSFVPDSEIVENLVSMGFQQARVERALRQIQENNVELAMEWILGHPEDESDTGDESQHEAKADNDAKAETSLRREQEAATEKKIEEDLQALYIALRDSFETVCFQILRVQAAKDRLDTTEHSQAKDAASNLYPSQNLTKAIAEYFSFLCSRSDEDRDLVIQRLNAAILDYFSGDDETGDEYLTMLTHLLALVLQLNPDSWTVMQLQSPSCVDKLVSSVSETGVSNEELKPSCTPVLLVLDAVVAGRAAKRLSATPSPSLDDVLAKNESKDIDESTEGKQNDSKVSNQLEDYAFEQELVSICLQILKRASTEASSNLTVSSKTVAHAIWQLLTRLTLKYDLASYFFANGGLDAVLGIPENLYFAGYQELTCTLLSQALESPEVLEHMMEDKIRRAISKLSTRFGSPNQMRITPRALLTEVVPFAARNETVFLKALRNSVRVKKTESGRTYIVPIPIKPDSADGGQPTDQPLLSQETGATTVKTSHKLPKDHKHHAQVIVHKIIGRIRQLWDSEKKAKTQHDAPQTMGSDVVSSSAGMCIGVYLQLLVHLITYFPACATVLAKAKDEVGAHGERETFIRLVLREFLPSKELCQFAAARKSLKEDGLYGNSRLNTNDSDLLVADVKSFVDGRTRMRVHNAHKLLVSIGSHSGEGSKCIILELVRLLKEWPQDEAMAIASDAGDLSVRDERALSSLHAWSGLIMSILWPKGSSKGFAWDKVVLGGGKHSFVTLLAEALRKIDLTHPLAHATCTMLLRPLSTLTRSFVTHRVRRLLKKRNHSPGVSGDNESTESNQNQSVNTSNADVSPSTLTDATSAPTGDNRGGSSVRTSVERSDTMEVDVDARGTATGPGIYPLREEDDDDVSMRSPLSGMGDHDMHDEDEDEHSEDRHSDRSSVSEHSTDEGEGEEDDDEDEDEDDDEDDEDDDDEDDEDEDEDGDEFEEHHHLHMSRRTGGHGSSRRTASNRLWGSLDSELSILDALDEVDEEEFSYLNMLDDEAYFTEEQRRRARLTAARNARTITGANEGSQLTTSSEDRLVESMRDALGLYNGDGAGSSPSSNGQTLVLTFGDIEDEYDVEGEAQSMPASTRDRLSSGSGFGSVGMQGRIGSGGGNMVSTSLLQYIEELPDMLDDDFLFESFDAGGRADRSRRERQLGRSGGSGVDQFASGSTTHPLLRTSGRGDAILLDSNGLLRNPGRFSLPRHSSLLRELQELTDQVQTQLPMGGSRSRLALGRDLLQRGGAGGRGRPPSRINRLSAVSNLLSEFSLDIPTSSLPSRSQRLGLRRGERDYFSDVFVGVDLSRGLGSRGGDVIGGAASNPAIWGPSGVGRDVDVRSVASRLEQQITRICADEEDPSPVPAAVRDDERTLPSQQEDVDDIMEEHSDAGTPRSGEHTASEARSVHDPVERGAQHDESATSDHVERNNATADAASVVELTSTLGESSLLRSPPESDVDVDIVDAEAETLSEGQELTSSTGSHVPEATPPPAPVTLTSADASVATSSTPASMMNFTLDLSSFGEPSTESTSASDSTNRARTVEEESKSEELPSTQTRTSSVEATSQELSAALLDQQDQQQGYQCPEGMDAEVFASLPPDMQAEIIAQNSPAVPESTSARSDTATAGGGGGSESMSQMDLDMANSSFDRETLEALPPDIRAEVLENERREREAAARAETADTSRAQEMDNASFVASLAPELREEILVTCDDAFLQTLPSQVRAEAMVLRERAAFRSTYRERDRGTEERGGGRGGEGDMDELFNRPTLRRMLTSHSPDRGGSRRRSRMYDELGGGRRSSRRDYRQGSGSRSHKGLLRVEKDEEEDAGERIFDDRCVRGLLRLLFMTQSVIQNRVFQRLLANICLYPLTRSSVRRNLLRVVSLPLAQPLVPGDEKDEDDDGSGKIQFPPTTMYGCGLNGNRAIGGSAIPVEVVNRMLHVLVSLAKYNPRFTVEMLQPHGMRHEPSGEDVKVEPSPSECGVAVLIDLLTLPVVHRNGTNLDALLELLELVLSPLERLHKGNGEDEEKKEGEGGDLPTAEAGDEWVAVPAVELDEARMGEVVAVLGMDLCTVQMQERTLAVLKLLNHVRGNRELVIRAIVRHASKLARVDRYKGAILPSESTGYESSAVLPSAQDELKLLRLLHSLSDVCENTAEFTECCQTIGLDPLWDALSVSLTEARAKGGLDDQDGGATASSTKLLASLSSSTSGHDSQATAPGDDTEGTVIEGKSAGASCAMAALLARFLPMVEAFFVVNARDAASMSLRVPDSSEREEAVVAALRVGGFDGADATALMEVTEQKASPKSALKRSSSVLSSMSEAGETMRLANFVESNRVLLNLLVREKPSLLDTSLAALIKIPRCRAYLAFDNKRTYFHSAMKRLRQAALRNHGGGSSSVRIPVRREHIFEDSYYALRMRSGTELRRKLHISFTGEEGIDAGGVTREWYMILAREMFNPNYVLFTSAADSPTFQPNPLSYVNKDHLSYFEFVGKVLGKAVADGQLLDAHFTRSFYKHILQLPISYHDMEAIDPEYYRNLHSILDNSIADLGLGLTFSAEQSNFGKVEVVDLIPNGRNVSVTDENKMEYVKLVTHHRMATGIRQQIDAFLKGFHQLVPPELIAIFNENELELLISGMPEIDIDDLKANTEYANYKPTDSVIRWFWNVLYSFTHEERALFLQFVTGTSKVPLEGFKALEGMRGTQKFNIHKAFGNNSALPSAHTW